MTPTALLDLIKKHGALGVLAIWLFYTNERLNKVEAELYRCYDKMVAFDEAEKRYHAPFFLHRRLIMLKFQFIIKTRFKLIQMQVFRLKLNISDK